MTGVCDVELQLIELKYGLAYEWCKHGQGSENGNAGRGVRGMKNLDSEQMTALTCDENNDELALDASRSRLTVAINHAHVLRERPFFGQL